VVQQFRRQDAGAQVFASFGAQGRKRLAKLTPARVAVANREQPAPPFEASQIVRTDAVLDAFDTYGPQFGWNDQTPVATAAQDLRQSRKDDLKEFA